MQVKNIENLVRVATIGAAIYLLCFAAAMAFFPLRPFWNDEWRLIYNIKFKDIAGLWGRLDLLQECPRTYLTALKIIGASFDYSYVSLRLPSLIIAVASVFFIFWLRKKLFPNGSVISYLFILILISSQTFTDYLVQTKQYEMDIFLCLLALWQLLTLLKYSKDGVPDKYQYLLLCFTFLIVPYFSYVYPITVAPIFPVILLTSVMQWKGAGGKSWFSWRLFLPLLLVTVSIGIFYLIDVKNVMADKSMYLSYIRLCHNGVEPTFIENFWDLFALVGSGFAFEIIFGVLGFAAFLYGAYRLATTKVRSYTTYDYIRLYAVLLLLLILGLFITGKLIGGVARLTAYSVPSISILIISLLEDLKDRYSYPKISNTITGILFLGLFGNIISTCINSFTYPEYSTRIKTYRNTAAALKMARQEKIPIMVTEGVNGDPYEVDAAAPGRISTNNITPKQIEGVDTLAAEVIVKVNPEYKVWDTIPVYLVPDTKWAQEYVNQLPPEFKAAVVGDGINYRKVSK